jgi:hypothetical protein
MKWVYVVIVMVFGVSFIRAQGETPITPGEGWTLEQRCVGAATTPEGWTFEGTILMTGHYGLHGVSADSGTPYVIAFTGREASFEPAALSPDGSWYARIESKITPYPMINAAIVFVRGIQVYSTIDDRFFRIPLNEQYDVGSRGLFPDLYWHDNSTLVFSGTAINPFEGSITSWDGKIRSSLKPQFFSPDRTLSILAAEVSWEMQWGLMDGEQFIQLPLYGFYNGIVVWKPDSSLFAAYTTKDDSPNPYNPEPDKLVIFNRSGEVTDTLVNLGEGVKPSFTNWDWSEDGRYMAFSIVETDTHHRLFIADMSSHRIYDTCVTSSLGGVIFAPDHTHLAYYSPGRGHLGLRVLDLEQWQQYTVAYHSNGRLLGWRGD